MTISVSGLVVQPTPVFAAVGDLITMHSTHSFSISNVLSKPIRFQVSTTLYESTYGTKVTDNIDYPILNPGQTFSERIGKYISFSPSAPGSTQLFAITSVDTFGDLGPVVTSESQNWDIIITES